MGGESTICNANAANYKSIYPEVYLLLKFIESRYQVVWPSDYLCDDGNCETTHDEIFIYGDRMHYSKEGSRHIGKMMNFYELITRGN